MPPGTMALSHATSRGVPVPRSPVGARFALSRPSAGRRAASPGPHVRDGGSCRTCCVSQHASAGARAAATPRHRAWLLTTYAAGRRVGAVVRRQRTAIARDRLLLRVKQGKGRKDRSPLLSARLLAALRISWNLSRPAPWLWRGQDATPPMPIATGHVL